MARLDRMTTRCVTRWRPMPRSWRATPRSVTIVDDESWLGGGARRVRLRHAACEHGREHVIVEQHRRGYDDDRCAYGWLERRARARARARNGDERVGPERGRGARRRRATGRWAIGGLRAA